MAICSRVCEVGAVTPLYKDWNDRAAFEGLGIQKFMGLTVSLRFVE